jgi:glycosyltransferase involved in cell wall biosynthesis/peptidoglycan/xylan/chitin deacetylase (PgdA/CDA1 family)
VITNRLYYSIKPLVPAQIRLAIRGWLIRRKRERFRGVWPILPGSERRPKDWPGWPDGKQFAFVLTHDVEGEAGVAKCRQLMEVEKKYGFRSSFNFIPEGEYRVSKELREELTANGFEVGVHDLHHDGKLYRSREGFARKAGRINRYLKEWGGAGFRSGFMFHNLEWLEDLDIQYDASTFDTDPFEPQPDGTGTIFPFWHEGRAGRGYVEMPYTLPQDSTLFLLMGEGTPALWEEKADWVAAKGGMVLLNLHPDYVAFAGESPHFRAFPVSVYEQFLRRMREKYASTAWHVLPKQVASFVGPLKLEPPRKPKRICMVTHSYFLGDTRVIGYAEALAQRGDHVDVVSLECLQKNPEPMGTDNINIVRLQSEPHRNKNSPVSHLWPVVRFLLVSSVWITRRHRRDPYDLLHIHNVPDFLVFAAVYPKLTGARVILDIHDIVPEFYASKFGGSRGSMAQRILKLIERWSARFSDHVIVSNHLWLETYTARTGVAGRCSVFINHVDTGIFRPRARPRQDEKFIVLFPGGLQWHQGLDIALRAFQVVSRQAPEAEFHIYGDGNMKESLMALSRELGLEGRVRFFDPIPARAVAGVMANADLGVVPKRADSFGNEAYSTKIMEFMSVGVPVVVSSTKIDRFYFNDSLVRFFESGNVPALAAALLEMIRDRSLRESMAARASEYAARNSWDTRKADYLGLVDSLCSSASGRVGPARKPEAVEA